MLRPRYTAHRCGSSSTFIALLFLRWIVLQKLFNGLIQIFLSLFGFGVWIDRLRDSSAPNQPLVGGVVDVKVQLTRVNGLRRCRRHSSPSPAWTITPSSVVSVPLFLRANGGLIGDIQIGAVGVCFSQTFLCQPSFYCGRNLAGSDVVNLLRVFDADPLVCFEL